MKTILVLLFCLVVGPLSAQLPMISVVGGFGAAKICGNESWKDPVGIQFGMEAPLIALNENTSVSTGFNVSL